MSSTSLNTHDINTMQDKIDPVMMVDEMSDTEYYVGWSRSFSDPAGLTWRIKRILKIGSVWKFEFPSGSQDYKWAWDDRLSYTYKT